MKLPPVIPTSLPVPNSRHPLWKRRRPAWNNDGYVKQNADNARQASQLAQSASSEIRASWRQSGRRRGKHHAKLPTVRKNRGIISVIDDIAFRLTFWRAGERGGETGAHLAGRGAVFAVVAGEVRNLANRSAEAAKEASVD